MVLTLWPLCFSFWAPEESPFSKVVENAAKLLGMRTDTAAVLTAPEEGSMAGSMIPVCYNSETLAKEMIKIKSRDDKGTILLMLITRDRVGGCTL